MKRYVIAVLVVISALATMALMPGCEANPLAPDDIGVGPNLLSEDETAALVLQETPLVEITDIGLQKCGPIYRVVRGKTRENEDMVVWVSDEIVAYVGLDEITSEREAIFKTKEAFRGCTVYEAVPVYIPDSAKAHAVGTIQESNVNTFWHITYGYSDKANGSVTNSEFVPMVNMGTALGGVIVAEADVGFLHTLYIVQVPAPGENDPQTPAESGGTADSGDAPSFSGFFDLVVRGNSGTELDRHSLNEYFGGGPLQFKGPVNLVNVTVQDETGRPNQRRITVGFPANDGSSEYRYAILTFKTNGLISVIPAGGYKDDGLIYTAPAGHSIDLTTDLTNGQRSILVGVENERGVFEPARYVWNGTKYEFRKDDPFSIPIRDGEKTHHGPMLVNTHGREYFIGIEQTEYLRPPLPGEPHFSIFRTRHYGSFHLVVRDENGNETSRVSLNDALRSEALGDAGVSSIVLQDYNGDGDPDFAIGTTESDGFGPAEFRNALFSIDSRGVVRRLPATGYKEDGYLYSDSYYLSKGFRLLEGDEKGILLAVHGDGTEEKYVWDGSKFVYSKWP